MISSSALVLIFSLSNYETVIKCAYIISERVKCNFGTHQNTSNSNKCNAVKNKFEDNLRVVSNYRFNINKDYLRNLRLDYAGIQGLDAERTKPATPVLVTAASENHFDETRALFENVHLTLLSKYPDLKIIFYDLGLRKLSSKLLQKYCKCEVRKFPFTEYPQHIRTLSSYTWKPIIVQLVLKEHEFVIWVDASIRFLTPNLDSFFFNSTNVGIKLYPGGGSISQRTVLKTFEYLGEDPCLFDVPELEATIIMLKGPGLL